MLRLTYVSPPTDYTVLKYLIMYVILFINFWLFEAALFLPCLPDIMLPSLTVLLSFLDSSITDCVFFFFHCSSIQ